MIGTSGYIISAHRNRITVLNRAITQLFSIAENQYVCMRGCTICHEAVSYRHNRPMLLRCDYLYVQSIPLLSRVRVRIVFSWFVSFFQFVPQGSQLSTFHHMHSRLLIFSKPSYADDT